uniref:Uncharacterized protein LOC114341874 isoform X1 n=1 Tax=Diabrotica virgifera virgifera TaxID=50390 RepID=A0A6P7GR14_DIAVI
MHFNPFFREEHLIEKKDIRKSWMNDNILQLMEERRKSKNDKIMYNTIQRQIRTEIRKSKENWLKSQCEEIESLEQKHDTFNMHKKVKQAAGLQKSNTASKLRDQQGNIITDRNQEICIWTKYIQELFDDTRSEQPPSYICDDQLPITSGEV